MKKVVDAFILDVSSCKGQDADNDIDVPSSVWRVLFNTHANLMQVEIQLD